MTVPWVADHLVILAEGVASGATPSVHGADRCQNPETPPGMHLIFSVSGKNHPLDQGRRTSEGEWARRGQGMFSPPPGRLAIPGNFLALFAGQDKNGPSLPSLAKIAQQQGLRPGTALSQSRARIWQAKSRTGRNKEGFRPGPACLARGSPGGLVGPGLRARLGVRLANQRVIIQACPWTGLRPARRARP